MASLDLINKAPAGTKLWLLDLGNLSADAAWFLRGAGTSTHSNPNPPHLRRDLIMCSALISHPIEGLILYENGAGKHYPEVCTSITRRAGVVQGLKCPDLRAYVAKDMTFDLNWQPFTGSFLELAQGLNVHHAPGHTPGLCILQLNLPETGTWLFTTDMHHVAENYYEWTPQGWLARDHEDWVRSHQAIRMLAKRTSANLVFGHDKAQFEKFRAAPWAYT